MYRTQRPGSPSGGIFGGGGVPTDVLATMIVIFVTYSLQFFAATQIVPALLRLTPLAWQRGLLWQVMTYPFVGTGAPNILLLVGLYFLFLFARSVYNRLGRRNYWKLLAWACIPPALLALLVDGIARLATGTPLGSEPLSLMQGQWMLGAVIITAFAALEREATILLFFVIPIRAVLFVPLTLATAFLGFLTTKDLAGFLGVCLGVGLTYSYLTPGGIRRFARESRLRLQQAWYRRKLDRLRRRRGFTVIDGDDGQAN